MKLQVLLLLISCTLFNINCISKNETNTLENNSIIMQKNRTYRANKRYKENYDIHSEFRYNLYKWK